MRPIDCPFFYFSAQLSFRICVDVYEEIYVPGCITMRKTLLTLISAVALAFLVACGGSSNHISVPPASSGGNPVGFSNANLNGNYVFAVNGINTSNTFAVAGVFTANGSGTITSGT